MPPPYNQLYVHCVWATWDRLPLITADVEPHIYAAIVAKCEELGCTVVAIGGVDDHVHVLVRFTATVNIARLIGEMKGASSHLITHIVSPETFFKWQGSYGAFTVSKRSIEQVRRYVLNQKQHHDQGTLIAELEQCTDAD